MVTQLVAASLAALVTKSVLPGDDVLFAIGLGPGVTPVQGMFLEAIFTFMLLITILMLAVEVFHMLSFPSYNYLPSVSREQNLRFLPP